MKYDFIYLASKSPRRRELLSQIGVRFELLLPGTDEDAESLELALANESAADYTQRVTIAKSIAALKRWHQRRQVSLELPWAPILCADTTVSLPGSPDHEILGKPHDQEDAMRILHVLSGQTHWVYTALAITPEPTSIPVCVLQKSRIRFTTLSHEQIERYVSSGEAFGKAGAYGIQGMAATFIEEISGSYSGIMGLPLFETAQLLRVADVRFGLTQS
ncbi:MULTISPECIES: Maf family protein [unclassified Polynucleobacter]|uniref:Maf family protein n=1 Tax=unclassified Polynucleobacter TaxID=2640945 RepID=UPI0025739404|nr:MULTISPECIES: Maf family protein [unclassified Polynucleobacter]BEI43237.1 Maf family protein [Polynucleobacter sp. HIN10]BEI45013.1 Maf family protein [Polynucleobacter sp. HIN11]